MDIEKWDNQLKTITSALQSDSLKLNNWEKGFINSLTEKISKGEELSFKQSSCLRKIYNKVE